MHQFINPELDCINTDLAYKNIRISESVTNDYVTEEISVGHATHISVFFRDLQTKKWYGINENETYSPGSLLKLPLAVAYFKLVEFEPSILNTSFTFSTTSNLNTLEHYSSAKPIIVGEKYTIIDFLSRLLIESDNNVLPTLVNGIDKVFYNKVLIDLGVNIPIPQQGGVHADFFSAKSYSAILRLLYNASYLNIEQSENILSLLSQSTFSQGLAAGIPTGIKIAHKFGEATQIDPNTNESIKHELHDCGIIYHINNPYILCVMTEGKDFQALENIIATISKITWDNNHSVVD